MVDQKTSEIVVFEDEQGYLERSIYPDFGAKKPNILFEGTKEEYKLTDWEKKVRESQIEKGKLDASPFDLKEQIIDMFDNLPMEQALIFFANSTIAKYINYLTHAKSTLLESEYETIKNQLSNAALNEIGLSQEKTNEIINKIENDFKKNRKFKKVK